MAALLFFLAPAIADEEADRVRALIEKMVQANRQLDYRGIFTYEHSGVLNTISVVHAVRDGIEYERLNHLNGPEREIFRQTMDADCGPAGFQPGAPVIQVRQLVDGTLERFYQPHLRDLERVAGRQARVINLVPSDSHRYGFILALDEDTGLLLQALLVGGDNHLLERFQFVDLEVGAELDDTEFLPPGKKAGQGDADATTCSGSTTQQQGRAPGAGLPSWSAAWVPPGFTLMPSRSGPADSPENRLYSDGLAEFSIFVDLVAADSLPPVHARRGATVAYLARTTNGGEDYLVCVVGEIPLATAQQIAESVNFPAAE